MGSCLMHELVYINLTPAVIHVNRNLESGCFLSQCPD